MQKINTFVEYIKESETQEPKPGEKGSTSGGEYGYGVDIHGNDIKEPKYITIAKLKEVDKKRQEETNECNCN